MGKRFWMKHRDDKSRDKQPGCIWGLVHVLDYHHWQSNVKKMIPHRKYEGQTHLKCDWSPEIESSHNDSYETEKLFDEEESLYVRTKRSRATKKRSLRASIKALIAQEMSMESESIRGKEGVSFSSNLQRTYSIHHLESLDDGFSKISRDWKHPIIFLPRNQDSKPEPDVLEIFKVDKELLIKHIQDADEGIANFSRRALGLNRKAKFSKSRSFPVAEVSQRRKLKPLKLESKQKEVWSLPREDKFQEIADKMAENIMKNDIMKRTHCRSSSLNESLDKYACLFENSFRPDSKLNLSKSLKLTNEYSHHAPIYFRRIHSLSNLDSYSANSRFEILGDDPSRNGEGDELKKSDDEGDELKKSDPFLQQQTNCQDIADKELSVSEGIFISGTLNLENDDEISGKILESFASDDPLCLKKNIPDLEYVRNLLDQSGIAVNASEIVWHSSDQLFNPQLFEEVEACWPHEQDQLTGWPDFFGCWHHQMLFDLVNEVLVKVYDVSLTYYPKSLSSSCHVRAFPVGNHIIDEVISSIDTLLSLTKDEKSLDSIIVHDRGWMNLQLDSECMGLELEDMIFNELLEEFLFS